MFGRIFIFVSLVASAYAQTAEPQSPVLTVHVNEVIVPVTVTDDKGRFVSDLDQKDFKIFDEGKQQKIRYFSREHKQPVVVGFLLDMGNSTRLYWKTYQEAAQELVFSLLPGDAKFSGYLITYSTEPELRVNTTHDSEKIVESIRKLKPGGGSALYDAIYMACTQRELIKGEPIEPRRVLVIIGDGQDNASKKSQQEVLEIAQRNLVTIYAISTQAWGFTSEGTKNLTRLCDETGGRVEYPLENVYKDVSGYLSTPSDAGNYALGTETGGYAAAISKGIYSALTNIAGEVTTQYIIRYVPDSAESAKTYRDLRVEVNLPYVKIRARKGYYPANP